MNESASHGQGRSDTAGRANATSYELPVLALEELAAAAGVPFDHSSAVRAWERATAQHAGELHKAWARRLADAGEDIGLRIDVAERTSADVLGLVRTGAPVVTILMSDGGPPRSVVVLDCQHGKVRLREIGAEGDVRRVDAPDNAAVVSACGAASLMTWILASPALPLAEAEARVSDRAEHSRAPAGGATHGHAGGHGHGLSPWRRLRAILRPDRADVWSVFWFAVVTGLLSLAVPVAVQQLVTTIAFGALLQPVVVLAALLGGVLVFGAVLRALQTYVVEIIQRRLFVRVVADLATRLPRVRSDAFDRQPGPELVNRFFDVMTLQKASAGLLLDGLALALQTAIGLLILAFYHPMLLGFDVVLLGCIALIVFSPMRRAIHSAIAESRAKYDVAGWMEELARHPIAFKLTGGPAFARARADTLTRQYLAHRHDHFRVLFRQIIASLGLQVVANVGLLVLGGALVIAGELSLGQLIAAELIVTLVVASFTKFGKHLESFYDLLAATDKIGHLLDLPLERTSGEGHRETASGATLGVRGLSFAYEGGATVLAGLNFDVPSGARCAITGPSGSGKSTLMELLYGLRTPSAGHIELDGTDLRNLRLESLREHVAVVKGFEIMEGTLLDNIRMGRSSVSIADVSDALRSVGLLDDVQDMPEGLQTHLSTDGLPLSVGQARRVMLARAIVGRPRLLLLDEALEGLDEEVRARVLDTLFDRSAPWTLVAVTHHQELVARCGQVVALPRVSRAAHGGPGVGSRVAAVATQANAGH